MSWTNKKVNSKTPPWILRQASNKYHSDPIGEISQAYSTQLKQNKDQEKNEKPK